jgi:hypothetical protein
MEVKAQKRLKSLRISLIRLMWGLILFEMNDVLKVLINQQLKSLVKRDSSVGIVIRLRNGRQRIRGSITDMRHISLFSITLKSALGSYPKGTSGLFPSEYTGRDTKLTIHLHLGP